MTLRARLTEDLRSALRGRDERRKSTIRLLLAAIRNAEIAAGTELDDAGIQQVVSREVRQRRESIEEFRKGGRQDLVDKEQAELDLLLTYLPQQMDRAEIEAAARRVIAETGARGLQDKGKVMPALINQLRGRADGREINEVVTELLRHSS